MVIQQTRSLPYEEIQKKLNRIVTKRQKSHLPNIKKTDLNMDYKIHRDYSLRGKYMKNNKLLLNGKFEPQRF